MIAPVELRWWLESQGVADGQGSDPGKGGTVDADGIKVTVTDANHSSSIADRYLGEPTGLVVSLEDGTTLYFAGDTNVFGDMALIRRLYEPSIAVLPIGDHYTIWARRKQRSRSSCSGATLRALPLGDVRVCHRRTPDALRELARRRGDRSTSSQAARSSCERALAGRHGPPIAEIVVEGEVDFRGRCARAGQARRRGAAEAFDRGRPVIVRAGTPTRFAALARPEVSCVVVPAERRELLALDLRSLTYG